MDPEAALEEAAYALDHGEVLTAVERLFGYYQWRVKGGYQPKNGDREAEDLAAAILDAIEDLKA